MTTTPEVLRQARDALPECYAVTSGGREFWDEEQMLAFFAVGHRAAIDAMPSGWPILADLIAGALCDLMGYLTILDAPIRLGASESATPAFDALEAFAGKRGLSLGNPATSSWSEHIEAPLLVGNARQLYIAFSTDGKAIRFWTHDARVAEDWSADNETAMIAYTATAAAAPMPADLLRAAIGTLPHDNMGGCPDEVEGWDMRDPQCAACRAIMTAEGVAPLIANGQAAAETSATASVAGQHPDCDSPEICAAHGSCVGRVDTQHVCGSAPSGAWQQCHACIDPAGCNLLDRCHAPALQAVPVPAPTKDMEALVNAYGAAMADEALTGHTTAATYARWARSNLMDAIAAHATPPAAAAPEPALWQHRWTNPAENWDVAVKELLAHRRTRQAPAVAATVQPLTDAEVTELLSSYDWRGDGLRRLVEVTAQVCAAAWGARIASANEEKK